MHSATLVDSVGELGGAISTPSPHSSLSCTVTLSQGPSFGEL